MQARAEALEVKRRLLAEVFARARVELARLRTCPAAAAVMRRLAAEAAAAVGEPCTVTAHPEEGTVTAASADGSRRADNGIFSRLGRAQAAEEREVARRLFGHP